MDEETKKIFKDTHKIMTNLLRMSNLNRDSITELDRRLIIIEEKLRR